VAMVSADATGPARGAALAATGAALRDAGTPDAPALPSLPEHLPLAGLAGRGRGESLRPVLGGADLTLAPVPVDLRRANLLVVGPPLSGRSTALATVAAGVAACRPPGLLLVGLGATTSPLASLDLWDVAGFGRSRLRSAVDEALGAAEGHDDGEVRVVVFLDGAEDIEAAGAPPGLDPLLGADVVRTVAVVEPGTLARAFSGWLAKLKQNRSVLQLQPSSAADVEAVAGRRVALRPDQPFPPGRGVLVDRTAATLIQVAVADRRGALPGDSSGAPS
jgi:DNA segregation ATPase FtsK/SpoIIIE, S-DNA-T family